MAKLTDEEIQLLAELEGDPDATLDPPPAPTPGLEVSEGVDWEPDLNPKQRASYEDQSNFVLSYGEKGSGKSVGGLHSLVKHSFQETDALTMIIGSSASTNKEGPVYDLQSLILPTWRDGNRESAWLRTEAGLVPNPDRDRLKDNGLGIEFRPFVMEPETKHQIAWIQNRHGGWSKIRMVSLPHDGVIEQRVKGPAPSRYYFDELTELNSIEFFRYTSAQLGRRRHIRGPQQWTASCNPKGPRHWVYQLFWEDCTNLETGVRDPRFSVHHIPLLENIHRIGPDYQAQVEAAVLGDPILRQRLVEGKWVELPSGDALFREHFDDDKHVIGHRASGTGLAPHPEFPILVGYDLGPAYSAVVFLQAIPTAKGTIWIIFDEVCLLGVRVLYEKLAKAVVRKMDRWNDYAGKMLAWEHIADDSAINQWRAQGSFDSWDFERHSDRRIRMKGCPKGAGSVEARVRLTTALLMTDSLYVSATCPHAVECLRHLEGKPDKDNPHATTLVPVKNARGLIHVFDALSYPVLNLTMGGRTVFDFQSPLIRVHQVG